MLHYAYIACLVLFSGNEIFSLRGMNLYIIYADVDIGKFKVNMIFHQLTKYFCYRNLRLLSRQMFFHMRVLW
jgi:hypothetical protein